MKACENSSELDVYLHKDCSACQAWGHTSDIKSTPHNGNSVADQGDASSIHWALRDLQTQKTVQATSHSKCARFLHLILALQVIDQTTLMISVSHTADAVVKSNILNDSHRTNCSHSITGKHELKARRCSLDD